MDHKLRDRINELTRLVQSAEQVAAVVHDPHDAVEMEKIAESFRRERSALIAEYNTQAHLWGGQDFVDRDLHPEPIHG